MKMVDIKIMVNSLKVARDGFSEIQRIRILQALEDYEYEKEKEIRQLKRELSK